MEKHEEERKEKIYICEFWFSLTQLLYDEANVETTTRRGKVVQQFSSWCASTRRWWEGGEGKFHTGSEVDNKIYTQHVEIFDFSYFLLICDVR